MGLAVSIDCGRERDLVTLGMEKERAMAARDGKEDDGECAEGCESGEPGREHGVPRDRSCELERECARLLEFDGG